LLTISSKWLRWACFFHILLYDDNACISLSIHCLWGMFALCGICPQLWWQVNVQWHRLLVALFVFGLPQLWWQVNVQWHRLLVALFVFGLTFVHHTNNLNFETWKVECATKLASNFKVYMLRCNLCKIL
jgi:hypothetical protein